MIAKPLRCRAIIIAIARATLITARTLATLFTRCTFFTRRAFCTRSPFRPRCTLRLVRNLIARIFLSARENVDFALRALAFLTTATAAFATLTALAIAFALGATLGFIRRQIGEIRPFEFDLCFDQMLNRRQ